MHRLLDFWLMDSQLLLKLIFSYFPYMLVYCRILQYMLGLIFSQRLSCCGVYQAERIRLAIGIVGKVEGQLAWDLKRVLSLYNLWQNFFGFLRFFIVCIVVLIYPSRLMLSCRLSWELILLHFQVQLACAIRCDSYDPLLIFEMLWG